MLTIAFQQSSYTVEENMTPLEVCVVIATPNSLDDGVTAVIQVDSMDGAATGIHNTHSTNNQGAYLHNTSLLVAYIVPTLIIYVTSMYYRWCYSYSYPTS